MLLKILVEGKAHTFQADSGSACDILPLQLFQKLEKSLNKKIPLRTVTKQYRAANRTVINFEGFFDCKIASASNAIQTKIFVMKLPEGALPILGENSLLNLGLMKYNKEGGFIQSISTFTKPKVHCSDPHIIKKVALLKLLDYF